MTKGRRQFTKEFKEKVLAEFDKGEESAVTLAGKYNLNPNQIYTWHHQEKARAKSKMVNHPVSGRVRDKAGPFPVPKGKIHPAVRVRPWGNEDGTYLITIGDRNYLGTEVALVPVRNPKERII